MGEGGGPSYVILTKWWVYTRLYDSIIKTHIILISCGDPKSSNLLSFVMGIFDWRMHPHKKNLNSIFGQHQNKDVVIRLFG